MLAREMFDVIVIGAGSAGACSRAAVGRRRARPAPRGGAGPHVGRRGWHSVGELHQRSRGTGRVWPNLVASGVRVGGIGVPAWARCGRIVVGERDGSDPGHVDDYERWVDEYDCEGWGWPEMLRPSSRSRTTPISAAMAARQGRSDALARTPVARLAPLDRALRVAITALGYPTCDSYHAVDATGVSRTGLTFARASYSTNDAYLESARYG